MKMKKAIEEMNGNVDVSVRNLEQKKRGQAFIKNISNIHEQRWQMPC